MLSFSVALNIPTLNLSFSRSFFCLSGVMNPPVLIDLNKDGTVDMVNAMFNSTVVAFDGETFKVIWRYDLPNTESYS